MRWFNPTLSRQARLVASMALIASVVAVAAPAATAAATCLGHEVTIQAVPGVPTIGTSGDDVIRGTNGADVIRGNGGNDRICSRGGADDVDGGAGDDRIRLGGGDDTASGGGGDDEIFGQRGSDILIGSAGDDRLVGGGGADDLVGGRGRDHLLGQAGNDLLRGNAAKDRLEGGKGSDRIEGGSSADVLLGGSGPDLLDGQGGNDSCVGGAGSDLLSRCEATTAPAPTPTPTPEPDPTPTPTPAENDEPSPTPTPTPTPVDDAVEELQAYIETSVIGAYGGSHPWLHTAWDFLEAEGTSKVEDLQSGIAGTVSVTCGWSSVALGYCGNTVLTMDVAAVTNVDVIIHELAHVLEVPTGVLADPGPMGMAQLYFGIEWASACDPSEVFADTLLHLTKPDAWLAYYAFACPALPSEPTVEAETVILSVLAGEDPTWFADTYANGTEAWAAVMTLGTVDRLRVVTNLAGEFGGYCSVSNTMSTAFFGGTDPNPWADDGC